MKILKTAEEGYVPTVEIWISTHDNPIIDITFRLKQVPKDGELDALRHYLKLWAKMCDYGELKAGGE